VVVAIGEWGLVARGGWDRRRGLVVGRSLGVVGTAVAGTAVAGTPVAATLATIVVGRHLGGQCVVHWGGAVVRGSVAAECERSVLTLRRRRRSKVVWELFIDPRIVSVSE
jgi:hypothetical protein